MWGVAQAQQPRQSEVTLRELEQKLAAASSSNDWQSGQVVAPEWTFIDPFGRSWDKPAILAMFKKFKGSIQSAKFYDVQVRFFKDDVAMVTGLDDDWFGVGQNRESHYSRHRHSGRKRRKVAGGRFTGYAGQRTSLRLGRNAGSIGK